MPSDSNTHRDWKVDGNVVNSLTNTKTAVNLKSGTNVTVSASGSDITVSAPNVYSKSEIDSKVSTINNSIGAIFNEIVFDCGGPND
jgi:hypothetical protein